MIVSVISAIIGMRLSKPKTVYYKQTEFTETTTIDTFYVERVRVVPKIKIVPRLVYSTPDTVTEFVVLGKKNYMDTVQIDSSFKVIYDIHMRGELDSLSIGYIDTRSEMRIVKDEIKTYYPKGLYGGGSVGINNVSVGVQYNDNKNVYGIQYNLFNPIKSHSVSLSYFRRIF
jgi:hypothetical protein